MRELTVLFDPGCELCRCARAWLEEQPAYVPLAFLPAGGPEALRRFPALSAGETLGELTVVSDDGCVWRGDAAWITCLWALRRHRAWALRLASPAARPLARAFFRQVSERRHSLSRFLEARA
jgi:predicted DCC family thiol-disulfide oxidoreductase YuxK